MTQGCNFGTLLFNLGYAMLVLKPLQEEFKGEPVVAICIHGDSAHRGDPKQVCKMMTRTMELGKENLALKYGEAKRQLYQSVRTRTQTSIDTDVDVIRPASIRGHQNPAGWGQSGIPEVRRNLYRQ